jgi:hypothetical protein
LRVDSLIDAQSSLDHPAKIPLNKTLKMNIRQNNSYNKLINKLSSRKEDTHEPELGLRDGSINEVAAVQDECPS